MKIAYIPDTQVKYGVNMDHLTACGNYLVEKKPDVIVHAGDHFDMPALSTYTKARQIEGRRVLLDLESGYEGMRRLMKPIEDYNKKMKASKRKLYKPEMHFTLGNHENRLERYIDSNPAMDGVIEYPQAFRLEQWGWTVHEFLKPVYIGGIAFAHYFYQPNTGRAYGGTGHTKLKNIKCSFVMGHQQGLDIATTTGNDGKKYWGITAGSFYQHDERYKGPQANDHFRGMLMLHDVKDGDCSPCVVTMDWLLKKYL
jgi:hypothetical protein